MLRVGEVLAKHDHLSAAPSPVVHAGDPSTRGGDKRALLGVLGLVSYTVSESLSHQKVRWRDIKEDTHH